MSRCSSAPVSASQIQERPCAAGARNASSAPARRRPRGPSGRTAAPSAASPVTGPSPDRALPALMLRRRSDVASASGAQSSAASSSGVPCETFERSELPRVPDPQLAVRARWSRACPLRANRRSSSRPSRADLCHRFRDQEAGSASSMPERTIGVAGSDLRPVGGERDRGDRQLVRRWAARDSRFTFQIPDVHQAVVVAFHQPVAVRGEGDRSDPVREHADAIDLPAPVATSHTRTLRIVAAAGDQGFVSGENASAGS